MVQCQKPLAVGASGSKHVTTKLLVSAGKPLHSSAGDRSCPPAPKMSLACSSGIGCPSLTSELLSDVMIYNEKNQQLFSKEIELVKKLVTLVSLFRKSKPDVEFFISGDPGQIHLPPMILFTLIDLIFRKFETDQQIPELNIEASGYSDMITVQMLYSGDKKQDETSDECLQTIQQLNAWYGSSVSLTLESHSYGCSVIIMNKEPQSVNTLHTAPDAFYMA